MSSSIRARNTLAVLALAGALDSAVMAQAPASAGSTTPSAAPLPDGFAPRAFQVLGNPLLEVRDPLDRGLAAELGYAPYWRTVRGTPRPLLLGRAEPGEWKELRAPDAPAARGVWLADGAQIAQGAALYAPLARELVLDVAVTGRARIEVVDGAGKRFARDVDAPAGAPAVRITGAEIAAEFGAAPLPRLTVLVAGAGARVERIELRAALPAPDAAALLREIESELAWFFATWSERALDSVGPRATAFWARDFDAETGATLALLPKSPVLDAYWQQLLDAWEADPRPEWGALLERHFADLLELGLHPATGLPRAWNAERDEPFDDGTLEVHVYMRHLLELAERGPQSLRKRALGAALRIGELVLARGVLPDGSIAAAYRSFDGAPSTDTVPIRRLDVPAQLARLSAQSTDARFGNAAREALFALEFAHHWPGTWDHIDPGFDDNFGHYGERAVAAARALPSVAAFQEFAVTGYLRYGPLLTQALRFGGNIAADQTRCWWILRELAVLDPGLRDVTRVLLLEAARNHFHGQQGAAGAWLDVTIQGFEPISNLPVGDTSGVPQNLLGGLAHVYEREPDLAAPELRAMFAAVMLSTRAQYKQQYGYVSGTRRSEGRGATNSAAATLRYTSGLVAMLRRLKGLD
ncbi:MAG: hypothetical protein EPO68_17260 [Planctomycetota bacterium]|nr:MAG: hypothetical protein EPO68_17260 [Planctomycetota bacterium]